MNYLALFRVAICLLKYLFIHGSFRISRRPGDVFTESMSQYEARSIIAAAVSQH